MRVNCTVLPNNSGKNLPYANLKKSDIIYFNNIIMCLNDSKIRLSLQKLFRILLKFVESHSPYLLYLFARLVVQRDF